MHIDHPPRREHRFLVGITEGGEDTRQTGDPLLDGELIRHARHLPNAFARLTENIGVVVALEPTEHLFGHAAGHELLPRPFVHEIHEIVDGQLLVLILHLSPVEHEGHTDRDDSQDGDSFQTLIASSFEILQSFLLLRCGPLPFLFPGDHLLRVLLIGKALAIDSYVTHLRHCLRFANDALEPIKLL